MDTPTLVLLLVVAAACVIFGPRPSLRRSQTPKPVKIKEVERVPALAPLSLRRGSPSYPHQYAAGRAPSPLRSGDPSWQRPAPQFATVDADGAVDGWKDAPLPHELSDRTT